MDVKTGKKVARLHAEIAGTPQDESGRGGGALTGIQETATGLTP